MSRRSVAVAVTALTMMLPASLAGANTGDVIEPQHNPPTGADGFQAGPCTRDLPVRCTPQTPPLFFKAAGGHPPLGFVQFTVKHRVVSPNDVEPILEPVNSHVAKTIKVDLPPGLSVNPEATAEKCSFADFVHEENGASFPLCGPGSRIGETRVFVVTGIRNFVRPEIGSRLDLTLPFLARVDLFNIQPRNGDPALFGFVLANSIRVFLEPEVAWESDFHESFTLRGLPEFKSIGTGLTSAIMIHTARLITFGDAGDGTLATLPTTCFNPNAGPEFSHLYSSWIRMDSHEAPDPLFPFNTTAIEAPLPPGLQPEGCEGIPFDPSIVLDPGTTRVDSASAPTVTTRLRVETPGLGGGPIAESHLRRAEVLLPEGMGLNPAGARDLTACPDSKFHKGERRVSNECPDATAIGTTEIRTPVLSAPLLGKVFLGEPKSSDPASGEEFRLFVEAGDADRGVVVRLIGRIKADPATGRLTAVFDDQLASPLFGALPRGLPQLPLSSLTLRFNDERKLLSTPPTCSLATTIARMEPWARPGTTVSPVSRYTPDSTPDGGPCPENLSERPFAPPYSAGVDNPGAADSSPLRLRLTRPPGQQELKGVDLSLPKGLIGKLAGIPYCADAAIAQAQGRSAAAERGSPSCPAASAVGTTATEAGTGPEPLSLPGTVYLAGPYKGAPLSLVAITPALSGPFDLGVVVIRVALQLDRQTAQISAASDLIPDVFGGVRLSLRQIDLNLDRPGFMLNPTSCDAAAITGTIRGGGADPADPGSFTSVGLIAPFQAAGCGELGFAPKLTTTISGPTKRGKYPQLSATLAGRPGDANVRSLSLALPRAFFVAQEHIADVCTKAQLASRSCPGSSAYGQAEAKTPLLDGKLAGPVYLVPGGGQLPDLVADLRGQVDIQLRGEIRTAKSGGIEAVFGSVPDVPVSEFTLRMDPGPKSLLVNSTDICKGRAKRSAALSVTAHSGAQLNDGRYQLNLTGCKKHKKKHKKHKKRKTRKQKRKGSGRG